MFSVPSKDKFYYLASPYSHRFKAIREQRFEEITKIAGHLIIKYGLSLSLPITSSHELVRYTPELKGDFESWRKRDLMDLARCDGLIVVMQVGWAESKGVAAEFKFALDNNKDIWYYNPITDSFIDLDNYGGNF